MRAIIITMCLLATTSFGQDIIPITEWPSTVVWNGKTYYHASISIAVKAGYRMLTAKPDTPPGKYIVSESIIQDPDDEQKCKYSIVYEDIPVPPTPPIVLTTNVASDRVQFVFTTNGVYQRIVWLDTPGTNQ